MAWNKYLMAWVKSPHPNSIVLAKLKKWLKTRSSGRTLHWLQTTTLDWDSACRASGYARELIDCIWNPKVSLDNRQIVDRLRQLDAKAESEPLNWITTEETEQLYGLAKSRLPPHQMVDRNSVVTEGEIVFVTHDLKDPCEAYDLVFSILRDMVSCNDLGGPNNSNNLNRVHLTLISGINRPDFVTTIYQEFPGVFASVTVY